MKVLTLILILAITMALSITVTMKNTTVKEDKLSDATEAPTTSPSDHVESFPLRENPKMPSRRVSRFLLDHQDDVDVTVDAGGVELNICHVHKEFCISVNNGHVKNSTCCFPRCVHLKTDSRNCGYCGRLCYPHEICCEGHCVNPRTNRKHCGKCRTKCHKICENAVCDYAGY